MERRDGMKYGKRILLGKILCSPGHLGTVAVLPVLMVFVCACATIGPSTVRLSAEQAARLAEMEGLHQLALRRYFEEERRKIEDFLKKEWEPLFLKNFLAESGILMDLQKTSQFGETERALLRETVKNYLVDESEAEDLTGELVRVLESSRSGEPQKIKDVVNRYVEDEKVDAAVQHVVLILSSEEPGRMIIEFAEAAHREMELQRKQMLEPLERAQNEAVSQLSAAYAEMLAAQGVLTARLEAASRVTEEQDRLLESIGGVGSADDLRSRLADISEKVDRALEKAESLIPEDMEGGGLNPADIFDAIKSALKDL
jgi:hypothetical protein